MLRGSERLAVSDLIEAPSGCSSRADKHAHHAIDRGNCVLVRYGDPVRRADAQGFLIDSQFRHVLKIVQI